MGESIGTIVGGGWWVNADMDPIARCLCGMGCYKRDDTNVIGNTAA